jgi:hypothetical protein
MSSVTSSTDFSQHSVIPVSEVSNSLRFTSGEIHNSRLSIYKLFEQKKLQLQEKIVFDPLALCIIKCQDPKPLLGLGSNYSADTSQYLFLAAAFNNVRFANHYLAYVGIRDLPLEQKNLLLSIVLLNQNQELFKRLTHGMIRPIPYPKNTFDSKVEFISQILSSAYTSTGIITIQEEHIGLISGMIAKEAFQAIAEIGRQTLSRANTPTETIGKPVLKH